MQSGFWFLVVLLISMFLVDVIIFNFFFLCVELAIMRVNIENIGLRLAFPPFLVGHCLL